MVFEGEKYSFIFMKAGRNIFCDNSGYILASLPPPIMPFWKYMTDIGISVNHNSLNEKYAK